MRDVRTDPAAQPYADPGHEEVPMHDEPTPAEPRGPLASDTVAGVVPEAGDSEDAVLLFLGGPLDGRVQVREARHGAPPSTVRHVHLHDGPKVVSLYDLHPLAERAGVYHLRSEAG